MHEINLSDHTTPLSFVQITDSHLLDDPGGTMHGINTRESLEAVMHDALSRYRDIDFILFTGDISQTGSAKSYQQFQSALSLCNKQVYCVPGNHDTPAALQQIIGTCPMDSLQTINLGNISLILLNSHLPGHHHGMLDIQQLQKLEDYLSNSNAQLHIIAIHHPPVPVNSQWLDTLGLVNRTDLLRLIFKYEHKTLLLSGHVHQEIDQQIQNIRLLATPSTCYQFVPRSRTMQREESPQPAYRYVRLNTNREIQTEVRFIEWSTGYDETLKIQSL